MEAALDRSLAGRVAIVTGGTSGIGGAVAFGFASRGATTVIVGRGKERAAQVAASITGATRNGSVEALGVTDLALRSETAATAQEILRRYPRIDVLVNNAGAYFSRRSVTSEGLERTFALNVVSPFLLTSLLDPRLRGSAPARVVNVSSAAHYGRTVDFSDLQNERNYRGFRAYGRSKLELVLLTREFARRWAETGVTVNAVHPGFVRSGFGANNGGATAAGFAVAKFLFGRSIRRGADVPLFAATDPSLETVTGQYFSDHRVSPGSRESQDMETARRLFDHCQELCGAFGLSSTA
jgi:retinol dehydrogenase 14